MTMTSPSKSTEPRLPDVAEWFARDACVPGSDHLRRGQPCQDAACAVAHPRPGLIVCDGRGSSRLSQFGASGAVAAFADWLRMAEALLETSLDAVPMRLSWRRLALSLYAALGNVLLRLSRNHGGACSDYEFTAAAFVAGRRRVGWLTVGDSVLVVERGGILMRLGSPDTGEFVNQTRFVAPERHPDDGFHCGWLPARRITGAAAFSDGTAARFLHHASDQPAGAIAQLLEALRSRALDREDVCGILADREWDSSTGDDRSLALLARPANPAPPQTLPATLL